MGAPDPADLEAILEERKQAERVDDLYGQLRNRYQTWQTDMRNTYAIYRNDWSVVWPDGEITTGLPMVPNFVQLAADDRSRSVASLMPSILVPPSKTGDKARELADKQERIYLDWLWRSRIFGPTTQEWAMDAMATGLTVCRIWADWDKPRAERYPKLERLKPMYCLPDPVFTRGPYVDSMVVTWEDKVRTIQERYPDADMGDFGRDPNIVPDRARVIEFYDDEYYVAIAVGLAKYPNSSAETKRLVLARSQHGLGCVPVTIGSRVTMDGPYRGEFNGGFGILNYWNRLMTLVLDDATQRVYDSPLVWNVQDADEYGPGVTYEAEAPDAFIKFPDRGNQAFSNIQIMKDLSGMARAMSILPPSRSGDPNESIISAAGISATQSQFVEDVRSIQWNVLAPMFEAAFYIGGEMEMKYGYDSKGKAVKKSIGAFPGAVSETYTADDLKGAGKVQVRYGIGSGLDPINTNVMVLQQLGSRLIDRRTAMEQSPFIDDAQKVEKRILLESLDDALTAGVLSNAQQGLLSPTQLADIRRDAEREDDSLFDIVSKYAVIAPVAPPAAEAAAPGAAPAAPGLAGAAEGAPPQQPQQPVPPLNELLGIARNTRSARKGG